jgi:hypothetical protein
MTKNTLLPVLSLLSILLCGCKNEKIQEVKNSPINSNLTFAQALENAPYCNGSEWSYEEDQNKRSVVKHTCKIAIKSSSIKDYAEKVTAIGELTARQIAGIEKVKYDLIELKNSIRSATDFSKKAEEHDEYITKNNCDVNKFSEYPLQEPCYRHISMSKQHKIFEERLKKTWSVNSINEASELLENRTKILDEDINKITEIRKAYNTKKVEEFPKEMEIIRQVSITLLPNDNYEWTYPLFYYASADSYYNSKGGDQPTMDITRPITNKDHNIDFILLSQFFKLDVRLKEQDFKDYLFDHCIEGCPIDSMAR